MSDGALIARVVPDVTGLDKQFDYLVPQFLLGRVHVGSLVRVPLGPRRVRGWVVELDTGPTESLRPIAAVLGVGPSPEVVSLAAWAAHRWCGRMRSVLKSASAATLVPSVVRPSRGSGRVDSGVTQVDSWPPTGVHRIAPCADRLALILSAASRGPIIVCTPSIDDAARLDARLRRRGLRVAVMPRDWAVAAGGCDVVVGSRTAVWAPCPDLAGIVVLDEHDETLQEERSPTWHARDVAIERARRAGVPCWLVSPSPSLEAIEWAGGVVHHPSRLDERAGWPLVEAVDLGAGDAPISTMVTRSLLDAAREPDRRVVMVLNTKGRARRLVCKACSQRARCERCGAAVSLDSAGVLHCARCQATRPPVCASCGSTRLVSVGLGISRLRDDLEAALKRPVLEVSAQTPDEIVESAPEATVFIGTEAVLHRVRRADAVVFLDFDDELLAPRFRAHEQAMTLLIRAARLVGPRAQGGRVLVQTRHPDHEVLVAALHADTERWSVAERDRRRLLDLPPECALARVSGEGASSWLAGLDQAVVFGSSSAGWLLRAGDADTLADMLAALGPRPADVRVHVDPHRV